jgi:thymidylate synthase
MGRFEHVNDVLKSAAEACIGLGMSASPRGMRTLEVIGHGFSLVNPRARLVGFPDRRWSLPLAIGEFCWHMRGDNSIEALAHYANSWVNYSDDGITVGGSCYGNKAFSRRRNGSPWEGCKRLLASDSDSRRAVITFDAWDDDDLITKDKSCLTTMQFLIREGQLSMVANMRSNDIYLGLPYDVFLFTMMQEVMALELGVEVGVYTHFVGSLHVYERNIPAITRQYERECERSVMPKMTHLDQLSDFLAAECEIRAGKIVRPDAFAPYWAQLLEHLIKYEDRRNATKNVAAA